MELKDYIRVVYRRKWIAIGVFLALFLVMLIADVLPQRPVYTATARIGILPESALTRAGIADLQEFYASTYGYYTKEALVESRRVYEFAAAVYVYAAEKGELPRNADAKLVEDMVSKSFLRKDGEDLLVNTERNDIAAALAELSASVKTRQPTEKVRLISVTAVSWSAEDARLRANSFGFGAELFSGLESTRQLRVYLKKLEERISKVSRELGKLGPVDEQSMLRNRKDAERYRNEVARHRNRLEGIRTERTQTRDRLRALQEQKHLEGTPVPAGDAQGLRSPLMDRLRSDITASRTEMTVQAAVRWNTTHPRYLELQRRIFELEKEASQELGRLRSVEIVRLKNRDRELEIDESRQQMFISKKLLDIERMEMIDREDRPNLKKYINGEERLAALRSQKDKIEEEEMRQQAFYALHERADAAAMTGAAGLSKLLLWIVLAAILAVAIAFILEYVDTNLYTDYDVRRHLNLNCVGMIDAQNRTESPLLLHMDATAILAERFNMAATILRTHMTERQYKSVAICSAVTGEGKTTVSLNMAIAMARKGQRVVLVDSDLRRPQMHTLFGLSNERGLSGYLQQAEGVNDHINNFLEASSEENLWILPSGPPPHSPVSLLESDAMVRVSRELRTQFDIVIFDTPPIIDVSDTLTLATRVDTCMLVVGAGLSDRRRVTWAKQLLTNVRANLCGVLLNFANRERGGQYYYYYYHYGEQSKSVRET